MKTKTALKSFLWKLPVLLVLVVVLFPFFWILISSFKYDRNLLSYPPTMFAPVYTLSQYENVLKTFPFFRYLLNTVIFAGGVTVTSVFFDSLAGYAFARMRFKGRGKLFALILMTMMVPAQILLIPLFLEVYLFGLLDTYAGLILPKMTSAFGIFMMRSFYVTLPTDLEEAGRIDGLNEFGIYLRIMAPLAKPGLISLAIFSLMGCWNDLIYPMIMTNSTSMRTLPAGLALFIGDHTSSYGSAIAGSMLSMLPLLIVYMFAQKYFVEGVAMAGLKG